RGLRRILSGGWSVQFLRTPDTASRRQEHRMTQPLRSRNQDRTPADQLSTFPCLAAPSMGRPDCDPAQNSWHNLRRPRDRTQYERSIQTRLLSSQAKILRSPSRFQADAARHQCGAELICYAEFAACLRESYG